MIEAAAIPETFFTVWTNVFDRGGAQSRRVAAGAWRHLRHRHHRDHARQGVRREGHRDRRLRRRRRACERLGADRRRQLPHRGFRRRDARRRPAARAPTSSSTWSAAITSRATIAAAAVDGRIVQIAFLQRPKVELDLRAADDEAARPYRLDAAPALGGGKGRHRRALRDKVWPLLAAGRCKPLIDSTFPLADAAKAHARMESSAHVGKIVLTI